MAADPELEFLPGDVITLTRPYGDASTWKLLERKEVALDGQLQRWNAEPADADGRFAAAMSLTLSLSNVASVVPGWRVGQRRRVLATKGHPAFEGTVKEPPSGYTTEAPAGTWIIEFGSMQMWALEAEPSELLAEAPAPAAKEFVDVGGYKYTAADLDMTATLRRPMDPEKVARARAAIDKLTARMELPKWTSDVASAAGIPREARAPAPRPELREVSPNGRDWVDFASLDDAAPFEAYAHRRIDGVEVKVGLSCGEDYCWEVGKRRIIVGGELAVLCDSHYSAGERAVTAAVTLGKFNDANVAARIRMRLMDLDIDSRCAPGHPHGAFPKTFGGIWRTR